MSAEKRPCPKCGESNYATDATCLSCGAPLTAAAAPRVPLPPPPARVYAPAPAASGIDALIPSRNPQALAAYYIGLFSLLPLAGLPMGIAALVLGIKGLRLARAHPEVRGTTHAWVGIICGGFWALVNVFIVIAIVAAIITDH
ncbi:zinc finger Ran-binding domain-containing protein [bacterium]|nr:zinc finger Ran-binding domain-containing protein [bacterium]